MCRSSTLYEFVFEMDGDFSHNPDDIPMFFPAALTATSSWDHLLNVSDQQLALKPVMLARGGQIVQIVPGMPFTDPTGGFKCFRRRALEALNLDEFTPMAKLQIG